MTRMVVAGEPCPRCDTLSLAACVWLGPDREPRRVTCRSCGLVYYVALPVADSGRTADDHIDGGSCQATTADGSTIQ